METKNVYLLEDVLNGRVACERIPYIRSMTRSEAIACNHFLPVGFRWLSLPAPVETQTNVLTVRFDQFRERGTVASAAQ